MRLYEHSKDRMVQVTLQVYFPKLGSVCYCLDFQILDSHL